MCSTKIKANYSRWSISLFKIHCCFFPGCVFRRTYAGLWAVERVCSWEKRRWEFPSLVRSTQKCLFSVYLPLCSCSVHSINWKLFVLVCVQESGSRGNAGRCCGPVSGEPDGPGEGADADGRQAHPGGEGTKVKVNSTSRDWQLGRHSDKGWYGSIAQHDVNSRRQGQANCSPFLTQTRQPNVLFMR